MPLIYRQAKGSPLEIAEMDGNLQFLNDQALVTDNDGIVSTVAIGGINPGDVVPQNTNLQEFIQQLLVQTYYPSLNAPSFLLTNNAGTLQEINALVNVGLTFTFDRGEIYGALVSNVWDQNYLQNYRTGTVISYNLNGVTQVNNAYTVNNHTVVQGLNSFTGTVTYRIGAQPTDSNSQNFSTPYPAGTSPSQSTSFEGVYPIYASTFAITTATKQSLNSMLSGNNVQLTLVAETGGNKQFFDLPVAWITPRPLTAVQYFNLVSDSFDSANKISDFAVTNTTHSGISYKRYTNVSLNRGSQLIKLIF
jgi:hypothetical protein